MKTILSILLLPIILFIASACDKNKAELKPFIAMKVNGALWQSDSIYSNLLSGNNIANKLSFAAEKRVKIDTISVPTESFSLYLPQKKLGKQTLSGASISAILDSIRNHPSTVQGVFGRFVTFQEHGEFYCEQFEVINNLGSANWIEITQQENDYKKIWGKFAMTLKREMADFGCPSAKYSDTTYITDGSFYIEYE